MNTKRTTDVLDIEYIDADDYRSNRSTTSLTSTELNLTRSKPAPKTQITPEPIAGYWILSDIKRVGHQTLAIVHVILPTSQLNAIKSNRDIVAHYACPFTVGITKNSYTTDNRIIIETFISPDTLLNIETLPRRGGAIAGHVNDGSGRILYEQKRSNS